MNRKIIWAFLSVFSLFACTEADDLTLRDGEGVVVSFTAPGVVAGEVGVTRADVNLAADATVRILVYRRTGTNADMATDTYVGENTYKVKADGTLAATLVDSNGKIVTGTATELRLIQGEYDFYAITPALPVTKEAANNARKVSVKHGVDYATSLTEKGKVTTTSGAITLTTLDRKCSLLQFKVDRKSSNVTSIEIEEVSLADMTNEPLNVFVAKDMGVTAATAKTQSITLPGSHFTSGTNNYQADGSQIVLPKWGADFNLGMKLKFNGASAVTTLTPAKISGLAFSQGTRYIFTIKLIGGNIKLTLTVVGWEGDINVNAGDMGASNSLTIDVGTWTDVALDGSTGNITGTTTGTWEGNKDWSAELGKNPGLTLSGTPTWTNGNLDGSTGNTTGNSNGAGWGEEDTDGSSGNITGDGDISWTEKPDSPEFKE